MSFIEGLPPAKADASTGVSCSLRELKAGPVVQVFLNAQRQNELFGRCIGGRKVKALIGKGDDLGKLKFVFDEKGLIEIRESMKGSVSIAIRAWEGLPPNAQKGREILVIDHDENSFTVALPPWGRTQFDGAKPANPEAATKRYSPATKAGRLQRQAEALAKAK